MTRLLDWLGVSQAVTQLNPIVESHTPAGTAIAEQLRADLERNGIGPVDDATLARIERAATGKRRPPQDLGKAYGRASATIYAQRCEMALLREGITAWIVEYDRVTNECDELLQALDQTRPAPDPAVLGQQLKAAWYRPRPEWLPLDDRWTALAETAIDAVRGLWPSPPVKPWPAGSTDVPWPYGGQAAAPETSPGGGESAEAASVPASTGAPTPGDPAEVGWAAEVGWTQCPRCRAVAFIDPYTICDECEAEVHTETLAAQVDAHLEGLAHTVAARDLTVLGTRWDDIQEELRELYRTRAADVVAAGWVPPGYQPAPAAVDRSAQVPVIAALLVAHERRDATACMCGWDEPGGDHAEHIAQQLLGMGAIA